MAEDDEDLRDEDRGAEADGGENSGEEGEEGAKKKGGNKKLLIIVAGLIVLLIGVGAGLYFTGMLDGILGKTAEEHVEGEEGHDEEAKEGDHGEAADGHGASGGGAFIEVPKMIVNLNTDDDVPRYLRLSVQLELENPEDAPAVEAILPRVVDQFQTYLRELRVKDLRGSGGIYRLQMELLWRVNQAAAPVKVKDVLFQEILIQ